MVIDLPERVFYCEDGVEGAKYEKSDFKFSIYRKIMNIILTKVKKSLILKKMK